MFWVLLLGIGILVGVPMFLAYGLAPAEVLEVWPVFALSFLPTITAMLALLVFRSYRPFITAPLPDSAAVWLRRTLDHLGKGDFSVATMDSADAQLGTFFHPASRTIVLADDIHGEHTARAYATAAHELGHALFHTERPGLARLTMAARDGADFSFRLGAGLLCAAAVTGVAELGLAGFVLLALAMVQHGLVFTDEIIASAQAKRILGAELSDPDQRDIARNHLRLAIATYGSQVVASVLPFVLLPWLLPYLGDGVLQPEAPLGGLRETAATVIAITCLAGAAISLLDAVLPERGPLAIRRPLVTFLGMFWTPLFAVLLATQPTMPARTIGLAVVPAWTILATPALAALRRLGTFFGNDVDVMPRPFQGPRVPRLARVSVKTLASKEPPVRVGQRLWASSFLMWIVPLALAWLGR